MPRPCTTCSHPDHVAIDKKLIGGHEVAALARKHGLEPSSLLRHKKTHIVRPRAVGEIAGESEFEQWLERRNFESPTDVLRYAQFCVHRMERLADKAEESGDIATAVRAISATLKSMESLFAKTSGLLTDGPTVDASTKVIAVLGSLTDEQLRAFLGAETAPKAVTA